MKKITTSFIVVFALLLFATCTTQTKVPEDLKRDWMLVEFQDFTKDAMRNYKAHLDLSVQTEPGRFSANMGCNNIFGSASFNGNGTVKFWAIGSTMMFCDRAMDLEAAFAKELPTMTNYKVDGQYLTLTNSSGNKMIFVAADWD